MAKKAQNLTRVEASLSGKEIEVLNGLEPGLGSKIHRLFSTLGNIQSAQAGHQGTVVLAEQKPKTPQGETPNAMELQGGRVGDASPAIKDDQYVTLGQVRAMLQDCDEIADCLEDRLDDRQVQSACVGLHFTHEKTMETGFDTQFAVEVLNENVYVLGKESNVGYVRIYRIKEDNSFQFMGQKQLSEPMRKMALQGRYIFVTDTESGGSSNFNILDIREPSAPDLIISGNIGTDCTDVVADGRFVYVASADGILIIDTSNPNNYIIRSTAA